MKMEVKLNAEELEMVITDYLKARGMDVSKITFNMKEIEAGVQWDPYKQLIFEGVKCEVEMRELPKVNYRPTNSLDIGGRDYDNGQR